MKGSIEGGVEREGVAQGRIVGHGYNLSPVGIRIAMKPHRIVKGVTQAESESGIAIVGGKGIAVFGQRCAHQFEGQRKVVASFQPFFHVLVGCHHLPFHGRETYAPSRNAIRLLGKGSSEHQCKRAQSHAESSRSLPCAVWFSPFVVCKKHYYIVS